MFISPWVLLSSKIRHLKFFAFFGIFRGQKFHYFHKNFCNIFELSENWKFCTFRKHRKNYIKLELWKLRKTRSNSKTDLKGWVQVQNAGPYPRLRDYYFWKSGHIQEKLTWSREHWTVEVSPDKWVPIFPVLNWLKYMFL